MTVFKQYNPGAGQWEAIAVGAPGAAGAQGPSVVDGDKGDISVTTGGAAWAIDNGAVTQIKIAGDAIDNYRLANMAQHRIKGRVTVGTSDPEDLTPAQARTVIASDSGGGTTNFFRADGTFAAPPAGGGGLDQATADTLYVNVAGDTVTGVLVLAADPVNPLEAATKQYVDATGGGTGDQYQYDWQTATTAADPGGGKVKCNNADPSLATEVYISTISDLGRIAIFLLDLAVGSRFTLYEQGDVNTFIRYEVTGAPTNNGPNVWFTIPVTVHEEGISGFTPSNNQTVLIGPSRGAAAGPANDSVTNAILANMPANTIKGNDTDAAGDPLDLTYAADAGVAGSWRLGEPEHSPQRLPQRHDRRQDQGPGGRCRARSSRRPHRRPGEDAARHRQRGCGRPRLPRHQVDDRLGRHHRRHRRQRRSRQHGR